MNNENLNCFKKISGSTMHKDATVLYFTLLVVVIVVISGCTGPGSTTAAAPTPTPQIVYVTVLVTPAPSEIPTVLPPKTNSVTRSTQTPIVAGNSYQTGSIPYQNNLAVTKNYFYDHIDNCNMQEIFPTIAKDAAYGLGQTPPKITILSEEEYNAFRRDYTVTYNGFCTYVYTRNGVVSQCVPPRVSLIDIAHCAGGGENPYWNFVQISATVTSANAKPVNYTVSMNIRSEGKVVAQFTTTELIMPDTSVSLTGYIPLKENEMDLFDGIDAPTFTPL